MMNVAQLLDRGGLDGYVFNAVNGQEITNAKFFVYQNGSSTPKWTGISSNGYVEVINLPVGRSYSAKFMRPNRPQAFRRQLFLMQGLRQYKRVAGVLLGWLSFLTKARISL